NSGNCRRARKEAGERSLAAPHPRRSGRTAARAFPPRAVPPQAGRRLMRRAHFAVVLVLLALVPLFAPPAHAQSVRAWLDRDRIALGETATLNIEVEGNATEGPDYSPLLGDFRLGGHTSRRSFEMSNGQG